MDSNDSKATDAVKSALEIHHGDDLKQDLPQIDWTEQEERNAKLK
jgi:hypothetical protein